MGLPKIYQPMETVEVAGQRFELRHITRAEAAKFQKMVADDVPAAELEIAVLAAATDSKIDETREWYETTASAVVGDLLAHIEQMARLTEEARKRGAIKGDGSAGSGTG